MAGIVVAIVLVGGLAYAGYTILNDDSDSKGTLDQASLEQVKSLEASVGHPIYWVGPRAGTAYELTETTRKRIFIRYLPAGAVVVAGDRRPRFPVVGTYRVRSAYETLVKLGKRKNTLSAKVDGGIAVQDLTHPTNVYVAYPGLDLQAEVYDPSANAARKLAFSGEVQPIR